MVGDAGLLAGETDRERDAAGGEHGPGFDERGWPRLSEPATDVSTSSTDAGRRLFSIASLPERYGSLSVRGTHCLKGGLPEGPTRPENGMTCLR
jgi:hypothetical protein